MQGEVLGVERQRRWDDEAKLAIVSDVGIDGATVTQVEQRHEVTRQQIYAWRHELKRKGLWSPDAGALFLPAGILQADGYKGYVPAQHPGRGDGLKQ
ncbi:transposase [Sedimentitalea sp. JM2-8]|uniref:Transposase n=1 Tax=Sedimentitalea xiamensis TaxID=3050037 RepID=A0ABT7FKR5_9RHOB|nr:transposase [Sedimentitalea xiamensis]MDK3075744.1 transposase [Sedimentitalea xiamensis]